MYHREKRKRGSIASLILVWNGMDLILRVYYISSE